MVKVEIKNQDDFEKYLKKFIKLVKKSGVLSELRDRKYYKKPSEKRKEKIKKNERNKRNKRR